MKVGILTLPLWNNYGGILQAFALREAVSRIGHQSVFIDVQRKKLPLRSRFIRTLKRYIKANFVYNSDSPYYPNKKELALISEHTRSFVEQFIVPALNNVTYDRLAKSCMHLDAIIVGSDQIWRPEYSPNIYSYFLDFVSDDVKKISYAASLGTSDWRFNAEQTKVCKQLLANFDSVSVREDSSVELVSKHLGVLAEWVCDPTLLLEKQDYVSLIPSTENLSVAKKSCFFYVLDSNADRVKDLTQLIEKAEYRPFQIMPRTFDKYFKKQKKEYLFPPVEHWIASFQTCELVVTDSFHGCIFSIIFNKPFIAIANEDRGRARFESLLGSFGLLNRLVNNTTEINADLLDEDIDWNSVNMRRELMLDKGYSFLRESLREVERESE
ncbi:MAG: hypothetical protein CMF22_13365 [Idiomarinaceae bacterium]|nr:hypothetical protein [Idiomarinaceae bacterium]HCV05713.1 polysaccharide pyruvyl transferase family protein [Pseudoalteromonas sp.]|tara:strand:+ start:13728 stop:14876 length:1149 start_codon:yes stop_codon:yes gene_type:complete